MSARRCSFWILLTVAAACVSSFSEDLDASLAAQKKKAQNRVYSEKAVLADHKLTVPRTQTEEEKDLDKKLQEMDEKLDSQPHAFIQPAPSRSATATVRPTENQNWLTPAMLDKDAVAAQSNETDNAWLGRELDRQKDLKALEAAKKENELVEKLMHDKTQQLQKTSPEVDQLKQYQLAQPKLFGSVDKKDPDAPTYMTPRGGTPDPLAAVGLSPKKDNQFVPAPFSLEAARISSAADKDSLRSIRNPSINSAINPNPGLSSRQVRSPFAPSWETPKPTAPTPLEMIRNSSPINRADPFADDRMPRIKGSIWE